MLFGFSLLKAVESIFSGLPVVRKNAKKRRNPTIDNELHVKEVKQFIINYNFDTLTR